MQKMILIVVSIGLIFFLISPSFARQSCGDENLAKWVVCGKNSDCVVDVIPCAQVRSINKKYQKSSKASQDCLSVVTGPCMPGAVEIKAENFRAICKAKTCLAQAIK